MHVTVDEKKKCEGNGSQTQQKNIILFRSQTAVVVMCRC